MTGRTPKKPASKQKGKNASPPVALPSDEAPTTIRKQRLNNTRIAILQSALDHFGKVGFEGASLRDIAADVGVNHAMIRHIYGTKQELWRQAITYLFERTNAELNQNAEALVGLSDVDRMKAYIRRYVEYCAKHPEHARIMIQQSILEGPELTWASEQFIRARYTRDIALYERLQDTGHLPKIDTVALRFIIVGACQMIYLLAPEANAVSGRNVMSPDSIRRHADAIISILFRN
jgi:AcrR family transcriptional regulator